MDRQRHAIRALFRTLRDQLPAMLADLDSTRRAQVVCIPGPYAVPANATLKLNAQTFTLAQGAARTAAELVAEIAGQAPSGFAAAADADGALVLTGSAAPTEVSPSRILVRNGTVNDVLGIAQVESDSVVLALSDPRTRFYERALERSDIALRLAPLVGVRRASSAADKPLNADTTQVRVELHVVFPGPVGEISCVLEAAQALAGAIYRVVEEGDGRGTFKIGRSHDTADGMQVVVVRPEPLQIEPLIFSAEDLGRAPIGQAYPSFEIEVFDQ